MNPLNRDEIVAQVKEALAETLCVPVETIGDETLLIEDLGADSFTLIEMIYKLEDATGIDIVLEETPKIRVVKELVAYVQERIDASS